MVDDVQKTSIPVQLGELGPIGLTFAAELLEDQADALKLEPFHAESLQMVVDLLRQIAAKAQEASRAG